MKRIIKNDLLVFLFSELSKWVKGGTIYSHEEKYRGKVFMGWG